MHLFWHPTKSKQLAAKDSKIDKATRVVAECPKLTFPIANKAVDFWKHNAQNNELQAQVCHCVANTNLLKQYYWRRSKSILYQNLCYYI